MEPKPHIDESQLLDWHFRQLDPQAAARVEAECLGNEELRAKSDRLRRILEPLDSWRAANTSPALADKVLFHVREAASAERASAPAARLEGSGRPFPFPRIRDLGAVAACILLLLGILVPGMAALRQRSQRITCASNLAAIFRGVTSYQALFADALPFAGGPADAAWLPGAGQTAFASNSRHPYLLLKVKAGPRPNDFVCPSDPHGNPMSADAAGTRRDFASPANVSLDTLSLGGPSPNLRPTTAIAYAADRNPLFLNARFDPRLDPDRTNSPAHRGRGQNVLAVDGNASFVRSPLYGERRDNVWLMGNVRAYRGTETPTDRSDSFLVPGFPSESAANVGE
ncbi:MAG: hypothetical protein AABZ12_13550 [Planctomycetota bacterium]